MPGPLPDPETSARNKSTRALPTTALPVSGYRGEIPEALVPMTALAAKLYARAWRSPEAASWHESDADLVAELCSLKAIVAAEMENGAAPQASLLGQITAREDRLLCSPLAKLKARAKIVDDPPEEDEDEDVVEFRDVVA